MDDFINIYLSIGIGFYVGLTVSNPSGFVGATAAGLIRGVLLGIVFWPIGLVVNIILAIGDTK